MTPTLARRFDKLLVLLAAVALWQGACWLAGPAALASPAATLARLAVLARRPAFWSDAAATAAAFLLSAAISAAAGVLTGAALGLNRLLRRVMEPVLSSLYALPKVTLYPVVLLLFGLGAPAQVAFGVMHGLLPIVLLTAAAVGEVPPILLRTGRVLRLSRPALLRRIVLPAVLPQVLGSLRIGVPLALLGVLIGEMFAGRHGLGSVAMRAMEGNDTPTLLAVAVLLAAAALGVNAGLGWVAGPSMVRQGAGQRPVP